MLLHSSVLDYTLLPVDHKQCDPTSFNLVVSVCAYNLKNVDDLSQEYIPAAVLQ